MKQENFERRLAIKMPLLYKFLLEKHLVQSFISNTQSYNARADRSDTKCLSIMEGAYGSSGNVISNAFIWKGTPEEHEFWSNLNEDLCTLLAESKLNSK